MPKPPVDAKKPEAKKTEVRKADAKQPSCPRCKLPLRKVTYEGVETEMCDSCWGFFLDTGELESILSKKELHFTKEERNEILDIRKASKLGPSAPAPCPKCGHTMERIHCDTDVHLLIDKCDTDGIWLDTGEIKKVQALAERSRGLHQLLLRKLGLLKN